MYAFEFGEVQASVPKLMLLIQCEYPLRHLQTPLISYLKHFSNPLSDLCKHFFDITRNSWMRW